MSVMFVGSNPSHVGAESKAIVNLRKWISYLELDQHWFTNVSSKVTPDNRPLKKSEYDLKRLSILVRDCNAPIVALGNTASDALKKLNIQHFKLPHPSPRNRKLNDPDFVKSELDKCKEYIRC